MNDDADLDRRIAAYPIHSSIEKMLGGLHQELRPGADHEGRFETERLIEHWNDLRQFARIKASDEGNPHEVFRSLELLAHPLRRVQAFYTSVEPYQPDVESLGYYIELLFEMARDELCPRLPA